MPVGSKFVAEILNLSSATIRNEMASLEKQGLLEKEHTSSGRIPSDAGYRYYINNLMNPKNISGEDMLKLQNVFYNKSLELNDCIDKSIELVMELTNCVTLKLGKASAGNLLREIRILPLDDKRLVIIMVTDQGFIESKNIILENYNLKDIEKTIDIINKMIAGTPLDQVLLKLEKEVKAVIKDVITDYQDFYLVIYKAFENFTKAYKNVRGIKNFLKIPEFKNDPEKISHIIDKLDSIDEDNLKISGKSNQDVEIYIGKENDIDDDITIVRSFYNTPLEKGYIDVIGPKRMDYERILTLINYINENIEKRR